jgi:hypothetical protein
MNRDTAPGGKMPDMDIAGRKINYKNLGELKTKLIDLLEEMRSKRISTGEAYETLRKNEESVRRLLGGSAETEPKGPVKDAR